jgi:hypothetical protein
MPRFMISRFVRQLSGRGALDNVSDVLATRRSVDAELDAFAARITRRAPIAAETSAAA